MRYATLVITALVLGSCHRDPQHLKVEYLNRGNDFFKAGKTREASIYYTKAIQMDKMYGEAYYRLALVNLKEGSAMGALRPLRVSVQLLKSDRTKVTEYNDATLKLAEILVGAAENSERNEPLVAEINGFEACLLYTSRCV